MLKAFRMIRCYAQILHLAHDADEIIIKKGKMIYTFEDE